MLYKSSDGKVKEILGKYESIIYKSIDRRAKEIFKETGSNEESFNFVTDEIIDLLKTPFNGTTFMRKLVDLRSNYEEYEKYGKRFNYANKEVSKMVRRTWT